LDKKVPVRRTGAYRHKKALTTAQNYKAVSCTKRPCDCYDRAM